MKSYQKASSLLILGTLLCMGCNETPVGVTLSDGTVERDLYMGGFASSAYDILWVVDNSGSMCQEQKILRDNFDQFINVIKDTTIDFHIGVTTTHAPESRAAQNLEPVAQEAVLSNVPQPVPAFTRDRECIANEPLRESLNAALKCVKDPSIAEQFQWSDEQITCVVDQPTSDCAQQLNIPDRNADGVVDVFDLFPRYDEYLTFPKVLKRKDYLLANGVIDVSRLKRDFGCISMVGTRGDGYERGLQVAVNAVSPEWTGGVVGAPDADPTKPNHGLIRKNSTFVLTFVSDENDCSAPKGTFENVNACGADLCDYYNSASLSDEESPLYSIKDLAESFRDNLSATKGHTVSEGKLLVSSIHGNWSRFEGRVPTSEQCSAIGAQGRHSQLVACETVLGKARSGDRYERFIRQFANYYPNHVSKDDPQNYNLHEVGWMCIGDFSPALTAIAEMIVAPDVFCPSVDSFKCMEDSQCQPYPFSGQPGTCLERQSPGDARFCDTGALYKLELFEPIGATYPTLEENPYCMPESIGKLGANTCLIRPSMYSLGRCAGANGVTLHWKESTTDVQSQLIGYQVSLIQRQKITSEQRFDGINRTQ